MHKDIIIVGAGIGGLQAALALSHAGHKVTLLESAKAFEEVGAGIRIPPNSTKLSRSWGVDFSRIQADPSLGNRFVDWHGNHLLDIPYSDVEEKYGAPYLFTHRADLVRLLATTAQARPNITIRMHARVRSYDFDAPSVTLTTGEVLAADLVVCADGIKSAVRDAINGTPLPPQDTGDVAYRILVPARALLANPTTAPLIHSPWAVHWLGPEGHAVGYPLRNGTLYNIIIDVTHASDLGSPLPTDGTQIWKSTRSNVELVARFRDWCPQVRALCAMTGAYLKWRLADFSALDNWVSKSGKVCLLGDACHPMMPYMAQGAAQATEDAAALTASLTTHPTDLPLALHTYERHRKPRAAFVALNTRILQEWLHLYDGGAKEARDAAMKVPGSENPIFWACEERRDWLFGVDVREVGGEGGGTPAAPPLPPRGARVYGEGGLLARAKGRL